MDTAQHDGLPEPVLDLLRDTVAETAADLPLMLEDVTLSVEDLVAPDFLLPALMVNAFLDWMPVVASGSGRHGFHVRLKSEPDALLGYRLTGVTPSGGRALVMPVTACLRRCLMADEAGRRFRIERLAARFEQWLKRNGRAPRQDMEFSWPPADQQE